MQGEHSSTGGYGPDRNASRSSRHGLGAIDTAFDFASASEFLTLQVAVAGLTATAEIELVSNPIRSCCTVTRPG